MLTKTLASVALLVVTTHAANSIPIGIVQQYVALGGWNDVEDMEEATHIVSQAIARDDTKWDDDAAEYKDNLCVVEVESMMQQVVAGMNYIATITGCMAVPTTDGFCTDCMEEEEQRYRVEISQALPDETGNSQTKITGISFDQPN